MDPFVGQIQLHSLFPNISQMIGTVIALTPTGIPIYVLIIFSCFQQRICFCKKKVSVAGCNILVSSSAISAAPSKCTASFKAQHILQSVSSCCLSANEKAGQEPEVKDSSCTLLLGSALVPSVLTSELLLVQELALSACGSLRMSRLCHD